MSMTLDLAFERAGGFGAAQYIALLCLSNVRNSGSVFVYMFAMLVMEQKYECLQAGGEYASCSTDEICEDRLKYRVDTNYEYYLENWYSEMDWVCQNHKMLAMLASVYFFSAFFGGLILAPLPDKIGRKKTFIIFSLIYAVAEVSCLYCSSYWVRFVCMGVMGFLYARNTVCYNWMFELCGNKHYSQANAAMNFCDAAISVVVCGFFLLIKRDWKPILMIYSFLGLSGIVLQVLLLPESPRFLLINGKTKEAIAALNQISRLNCSK